MKKISENSKRLNLKKLTRSGISLIVLVIAIIVIIILAAAIIISLNNNNTIMEANKARYESDRANMQAMFTNAVAKVMAKNQATLIISPGQINTITAGKKEVEGEVAYTLTDAQNLQNSIGTIVFDKKINTDTTFYIGKKLPIYAAGETKWYVDEEGNISLEVAGTKYGSGDILEETGMAFAIYSDTDKSLRFYKNEDIPVVGEIYNGYEVTAIYEGIENQSDTIAPWNSYKTQVKKIEFVGTIRPVSTAGWFCDFSNCTEIKNLVKLDTSETINMQDMFNGCSKLTSLDLSKFKTSKVTNMYKTFMGLSSLTEIDLSGFDTSNVENLTGTFGGMSNLKSIDLSGFDTSKVTQMRYLLGGCTSLESVNVSGLDVSKVKNMSKVFEGCKSLKKLDISDWDTSSAEDMEGLFKGLSSLESLDIAKWKKFNTSNVWNMRYMFSGLPFETLDLSMLDTSAVLTMSFMFHGSSNLKSIDLSSWDTSNVGSMDELFWQCSSLKEINFGDKFDTSSVYDFRAMFGYCRALETIDLSVFDTAVGNDFSNMFRDCTNLKSVNLSSFDTSSATKLANMFYACTSLEEINLSNFNTSKVTDVSQMFFGCKNLKTINLSSFDTSKVINFTDMFKNCAKVNTALAKNIEEVNRFNLTHSYDEEGVWAFESIHPTIKLVIDNKCTDLVTVTLPDVIESEYTVIKLDTLDSNNIIYSFELNGNVVYGSKFVAPSESGTIVISNVQVLKVQNNCTDLVSLNIPESLTIGVSKILLNSNVSGKGVSSFKLNGKTVEGDNFIVTKDLGNSIIITDVVLTEGKTIESSHYPVSESDCGAIQEIRFSGATSVKVTVTYQTGNNAMVILTDQNAENPVGEGVFNSNDLTTETYVIDGEGVMFMYYASSMDDLNYYGYKVTVVPFYN